MQITVMGLGMQADMFGKIVDANRVWTSATGSAHTHTFTGSATSVVQPSITVYFWKRTA